MVNLDRVPTVAITMVVIAAVFVSGFLVLDGLDDDLAANSYGANATADLNEGLDNIVSYAPTWGTIIGVAVLLAIVIGGLAAGFLFGRGRGMF